MLFPTKVDGLVSAGIVAAAAAAAVCSPAVVLATPLLAGVGLLCGGKSTDTINTHERQIQYLQQEERQYEIQLAEYKKVQLEMVYKVKMLTLQEGNIGNVSALDEVSTHLVEVDAQLNRLREFWNAIVISVDQLNMDTHANEIYMQVIPRLKEMIETSERKWRMFLETCQTYIRACRESNDEGIHVLYRFLSLPVGRMTREVRQQRQNMLTRALTNRVEAL